MEKQGEVRWVMRQRTETLEQAIAYREHER